MEPATLDLRIVSVSPTVGVAITFLKRPIPWRLPPALLIPLVWREAKNLHLNQLILIRSHA